MKRVLALILAALLLTGCAGPAVHDKPSPVSGGEPVGGLGNLWYLPNETLEQLGPRQLLDIGSGLLLCGGGQLALLSAEDLSVLQTMEASDSVSVQALAEGFCLTDPKTGTVTILDSAFQTLRVLSAEPGERLLVSPDGQKVYTVTDAAITRDGQALGQFRSLRILAVEKDRVFLQAVGTADLVSREYVLELQSGVLTEEQGSRKLAMGRDCLPMPGGQWLQMVDRALLLYEQDGIFRSWTQLPEDGQSRCGTDFVWSERWQGWFFLDHTPEKTRLMFWDCAPYGQTDPLDIHPETVPEGELLDRALYDRAAELSGRFSVDIRIGERTDPDYKDFTAQVLADPEVTARALDILEKTLGQYPDGFLAQLPFDNVEAVRIEIVDGLERRSEATNAIDTSAFAQERNGYYLVVFNARKLQENKVYHEFSHIIDKRLAWEAQFRPEALFSEEAWMALQPEGFAYAGSYTDIPASVKRYYDSGYFYREHSCVSASEDRADTMERAAMLDRAVFAQNPGLLPKLRYYADCIRDSFDTTGWPETLPWEELLR